ncbi:MAG: response regulator [Actinomycetota bacterium]|nr:response regulator [Actinomycetota bacterium]
MKIEARCRTCDRNFLLSQIGPASDAPGRCPFCGARFAPSYTPFLVEAVPQAEAAATQFVQALGRLQAMDTGFEVDIEGVSADVARAVWASEGTPLTDFLAAERRLQTGGGDGAEPLKVVVVTGDEQVQEEVRFGFPTGVEVSILRDAREAWEWMHDKTPSVAIMDIQTGSAGGFGLARDMAQDPKLAAVPVLMLIERRQDEWLAEQAGATSHRIKPVDADDLVAEVLSLAGG